MTEQESNDDNYMIDLPQHFCCCSHTLNLIATVDVQEALKNTYKKFIIQRLESYLHCGISVTDQQMLQM